MAPSQIKANHTFFSGMQPTQKAISRMSCDSQGSTGPKKCLNTRLKSLHPSKEWNRQHSEDYVLWLFSVAFDTFVIVAGETLADVDGWICCIMTGEPFCVTPWLCVTNVYEKNRLPPRDCIGCLPVQSVHNIFFMSSLEFLLWHSHSGERWWKMRWCCTSGGLTL